MMNTTATWLARYREAPAPATTVADPDDLPLCDRCLYDRIDTDERVPDMFADRYLQVCAHCAAELHRIEAKLID